MAVSLAALSAAGSSAFAQIPAVPTVTPPTVPQLPPVPDVPDLPVPDLPAPDVPDLPAPLPEAPDAPALPLPGGGGAEPTGESGAAPRSGASGGGGGSATASGGGSGAAATPGAAPPGSGPRAAGTARRRATARAGAPSRRPTPLERRERRLRSTVARLSGCLDAIRPAQRRVLVLRAGLGPGDPLSRAAVARRLDAPLRTVRRTERRGLRALRATARGGCGRAGAGADPPLRTTAFHLGAARDDRGGDATGTATGSVDEPGRSGVMDEFRSGPGGAPDATLTPPPVGGGDGGPLLVPLLALSFLVGFAAVWALERRRVYG